MTPEELLQDASVYPSHVKPSKSTLAPYIESIHVLREKGYTWLQIMDFVMKRVPEANFSPDRKLWAKNLKQWRETHGK